MKIDFSKPLEAVHEDGRIGGVEPRGVPALPEMAYGGEAGVGHRDSWRGGWRRNGSPIGANNRWTIRNVVKTEDAPPIPAPIAERMRGLIADIAERRCVASEAAQISARAIMAELTPVDPDIAEIHRITNELMADGDQIMFDSWEWKAMAACLARGRELEREGR